MSVGAEEPGSKHGQRFVSDGLTQAGDSAGPEVFLFALRKFCSSASFSFEAPWEGARPALRSSDEAVAVWAALTSGLQRGT